MTNQEKNCQLWHSLKCNCFNDRYPDISIYIAPTITDAIFLWFKRKKVVSSKLGFGWSQSIVSFFERSRDGK